MNSTFRKFLLLIIAVFSLSVVAVAQEDDATGFDDVDTINYEDPAVEDLESETTDETIVAITDNSDDYYGAVVSIEGTVVNFLSPNIFEVGEVGALTNSRVLVVNNSSHTLSPDLIEGTVIRVTGRVLPSHDVIQDGYDWTYEPFHADDAMMAEEATEEPMMEGTEEAMEEDMMSMEGRMNLVSFVQAGYIPGAFGQHTLLEVLNVESIEVMDYTGLIATDD